MLIHIHSKHGCDYKGYGLASRLPRLDLSAFTKEKLEDRKRPIVQQFCVICQLPEKSSKNKLISCEGGCSRAYHQDCHTIKDIYCNPLCHENKQKNKVGKVSVKSRLKIVLVIETFYYH